MRKQPKLLSKTNKGTYVCAKFNNATIERIRQLQSDLDLMNPTPSEKLHSTIVYSHEWIPYIPVEIDDLPISQFNKLELWDTKYGKTLVLVLDAPYLHSRNTYAKLMGSVEDFKYNPHITISYDVGVQKIDLVDPNILIEMISEKVEDLDVNWK